MKREGNLIERISDPDNLRLAYWKAHKGKEGKQELIAYTRNLDKNLKKLRISIEDDTVEVGNYHYFTIYDPKERKICAASFGERVLHHALMNICHANFEKYQVYNSFASRPGKGVVAGIEQAKAYQKKFAWFLKLDVKKFFDSIDQQKLVVLLTRRFKDRRLIGIFEKIILSYSVKEGKGLPIGNLTSQYFANHYLAYADHYLLETLKIKAYVRYMDDMVLWDNDKATLLKTACHFRQFLAQELLLELKPFCLNTTNKSLPFCGYLIYRNSIRLNAGSRKRFATKLKKYWFYYENKQWTQPELQQHLLPLFAFVKYANSHNLRLQMMTSEMTG